MSLLNRKNEIKYIAVFCIPEGKGYRIRKRVKFNPDNTNGIRYKDKRITGFDIEGYLSTEGLKRYYYFDISGEGRQIYSDSAPLPIDPSIAYLIIDRHVVRELTYNLSDNPLKMQILPFILGCIIGIFGTLSVLYFMK